MSIGKRLTLGFAVIAMFMVFVGALYIYQNISIQAIAHRDIYKSFFILNSSWELMETIEHQQMAADRYLFFKGTLDENRANYYHEKDRFITVYDKFHSEAGEPIKQWLEKFYQKVMIYNKEIEEVFALFQHGRELRILKEKIKEAEIIEAQAHDILWKIITYVQDEQVAPAKIDIANKITSTIRITVVSVIASLLFAIGLGIYITRSIAVPITKLKDTISTIGHGNLDTQVTITSHDEIGILAKAFNQMLSDLKQSHANLEDVMAGLEERVRERTAALTQSQIAKSKMIRHLDRQAQELRDAQDKLVRSEKLAVIGQLASSVAHELRNPLGVMKNVVYYFHMITWDKENLNIEDIMDNLTILSKEIDNANKVISDLLEFTNIKKPVLHKENINTIIKETLNRLEIHDGIEIKMELDVLPDIEVDALHMQQVFYNIMTNALQAMDTCGSLTIKTKVQGNFVTIFFIDTGSGIPQENLLRIFEPLFTTKAKGTGLGLSVCNSLVERHKGRIEVTSERGKGTTFVVFLPLDLYN
ncbi:MAG: ATP-binding protein [bacterium]